MKQSLRHNIGLVALTASAWVSGADLALAQAPVGNGNFGTEVVNVATIDFTVGSVDGSVETNAAVFTIRPPRTVAEIEFFRYSPNAPNPIYRILNGSDFSPSGDLVGPFEPVGDPLTAGGNVIDISGEVPLIEATTYLSGELMIVCVNDMGANTDSQEIDTVSVEINADSGDVIVLRLYESGPDTGEFWAYMPSTDLATPNFDKTITASGNASLRATYINTFDQTDVVVDTAIVNPLNRVFSSVSGDLIDNAVIKLMNVDTGAEATVYGVDGFSAFPSSVVSGDDVQDESGLTYDVDQGEFRFPVLAPGRYIIDVEPPEGFNFASVMPAEDLATIKGSGFVLTPASFGQEFVIEEMSPLRFDIPLDPEAEVILTKTADRSSGDVGDYINYTVSVRNSGIVSAPARIYDTLPLGFRYVPGTTRIEQSFTNDPEVSDDAALLEFDMGFVAPGETITLNYALLIGPGAALGDAVNEAVVRDSDGEALSNVARAGIKLREDLLRSTSTIVGRMTEKSCDGDEDWVREIDRGVGVEGVRLYMETGAYTVSDSDGLFHFEGVSEGTHVVQVDEETLPKGFELMQCEENTRYAGAMNSQFVDVQGGGIWRANFYLKQTGAREEIIEEEVYNDRTDYKRFDAEWIETQTSDVEWIYPETTRTPSSSSVHIGIKHGAGQSIELTVNDRPVFAGNYSGRETNIAQTVHLSRWRSVDLLDGRNVIVATVKNKDGSVAQTLKREVNFVKTIARVIPMPDQSTLVADGRTVPIVAIRMEDQAGRAVHSGRITSIEVEPPYRLYDENYNNELIEQSRDLITPLSAKRDFTIGTDGIVEVKLDPTLRTGKVTVIATLDNGRKIPVYMYLTPEKRDWILVGLAEGSIARDRISGNSVALEANGGTGNGARDVITDGRVAFFAKGLIKGNWLMSLAVDTDTRRGNRDGDFNSEIDPNAYYTLYGDQSYQEFEGVSRYPVFVKLEKSQAYAMFGDYSTNISEGRLTNYNRRLSGLKAEYIGENLQVLGFAAETNQGFAKDEIAADGTSGTYQLLNDRVLAQSEEVVIETRDRFRPDVILDRKVMVRYLDYTLDYLTGQIIFRLPVDATDANFNPNVIVVDYETSKDAERNITAGGRVQAEFLGDKLRVGSTFVHEEGSAQAANSESNQIGIDILAQVTPSTQIRAEYAITENKSDTFENTADAKLLEIIHTSENVTGEVFFREEENGFGLGQTGSNTNAVRRYGAKSNIRVSEFEDEKTGRRGSRYIEAQAYHEENLNTGDTRNSAEILATHEGVRNRLSTGIRVSEDKFDTREDRQSILAIAKASIELPKHGATFQISHEQPLSGNDEVSAFPMRTTLGVDKTLGNRATASIRHEILDGANARSHNTVVGVNASLWKGGTLAANSDLMTQDSGRRLGATIGLDQSIPLNDKWSVSAGVRERRILDSDAEFVEVAPDAAISPVEVNEDFRSGYIGAAYRDDVMSGSARLEGRQSSVGDSYIASAAVARELSEELSLAGAVRSVFNESADQTNTTENIDIRLGAAWRPRDEDTIVFNRFDFGHSKDALGQTTTKLVNNVAVNTQINDRWQLSGNWGAKHVRTDIAGKSFKNDTHLLGAETRYDLTPNLDLGFRAQMMTGSSSDAMSYSYGPSVGLNPAKNVWLSAGYNVQGFKDDDFEAAEYSRKGFYLQMRVKFDQDTASGLLKRISPANDVIEESRLAAQALSNP